MPSKPVNPRLVVSATSWNYTGKLSRRAYREGYFSAASLLVQRLAEEQKDADAWIGIGLVYPVMYLYRHFVEISIKDILALARSFTWVSESKPKRLGHSLADLWKELLDYVGMLHGTDAAQELDEKHGALVGKLHAIDPSGDRFRYPLNTSGDAQFGMSLQIDLMEIMNGISEFRETANDVGFETKKLIDRDDPNAMERTYFY